MTYKNNSPRNADVAASKIDVDVENEECERTLPSVFDQPANNACRVCFVHAEVSCQIKH